MRRIYIYEDTEIENHDIYIKENRICLIKLKLNVCTRMVCVSPFDLL